MIRRVIVDIDGTLTVGGTWMLSRLGLTDFPEDVDQWPVDSPDLFEAVELLCNRLDIDRIPSREVIRRIDEWTTWACAPMSFQCYGIIAAAIGMVGVENVLLMSSFTYRPFFFHQENGSEAWVSRHLHPTMEGRFVTGPKWQLADEGTLLIDDMDKACDDFEFHGGQTVMIPRPWNSLRHVKEPTHYFFQQIERFR